MNDWLSAFMFFVIAAITVLMVAYPVLKDFRKVE